MNKVWQIAVREFVATVFTKAFIIGLLIFPTIAALMVAFGPRLFGNRDLTFEGEIAVVDPTGVVLPRVRDAVTARRSPVAVSEIVDRARAGGAQDIVLDVLGASTRLTLVERPAAADVEREKLWLTEPAPAAPASRARRVARQRGGAGARRRRTSAATIYSCRRSRTTASRSRCRASCATPSSTRVSPPAT